MGSLRIGHGYDVHQLVEGRPLVLGGVHIPYNLGLLGHSDADVLAHALSDAILGAARAGDIGKLFPDTDAAYKDADSLVLLASVMQHVRSLGFELVDADCTLACEQPKLSPHRYQMRANLARAMGVSLEQVGVKATTTEQLGWEGQGLGIGAWAVCLLEKR
ncbi:2-C-methyl-D-erythritol 2,4-cyclodiphosphate synthase [Collinsella sp. zg1085]|uniref:2-C-methyl-D-erythritol 2,4-cyclodiphosphate synthase n=1 Tax=Collinsella sp. zg1085 TaxID=2844380 RepID=UPI001C0BBF64|nr:2-C-methyl-D-erythritol 2,4-cyclodiphosphate synthase [Collinsella sp. zg1085]QWT17922.1 2-C-methyl-D-erythritol 2,4-cyclodiphosphate synthase [Collinsella sp. zg1085]